MAGDSGTIDASVGRLLTNPIRRSASPGLIAAVVDREGVGAIAAAGVRKAGHPQPLLTTDVIHIGSNTKAMTSVLLAGLVRDGVFANGWNTTIGDVFPDLAAGGAMAERVTGRRWETLMRELLFTPLGMSSAGFGAPGAAGRLEQPWGHRRDPASGDWVPNPEDNAAALGPAGTVHVTIRDWARFMALWLPEAPPAVLDREAVDRLITPASGDYAAGWIVAPRSWARGVAITHSGCNTSWCATLWIAPQVGRAYVAAANSAEPDPDRTLRLLDGIVANLIRRHIGVPRAWPSHSSRAPALLRVLRRFGATDD